MHHFRCLPVVVGLLLFPAVLSAQKQPPAKEPPQRQLTVFPLRYAPAESVGKALRLALEGRSDVQVAAVDAVSNTLFVTVVPEKLKEVAALVKTLDTGPKVLSLEVLILDVNDPTIDFEAKEIQDLKRLLSDLHSQQALNSVEHVRLTTVENQPAMFQAGAEKPVVVGRFIRPSRSQPFPGGTQYQTRSVGTLVELTARMAGQDGVLVNVRIEKSALDDTNGPARREGEEAEEPSPVPQASTTLQVTSSIHVPLGGTVALGGLATESHQRIVLLHVDAPASHASEKSSSGK